MWIPNILYYLIFLSLSYTANAYKYLRSDSLLTCMENSEFSASYFDVYYYPHNSTVLFYIDGFSSISGKIKAEIDLVVYGLSVYTESIDLCSLGYKTICPISSGHIDVDGTYTITSDLTKEIPSIAYTIPDLDAYVKVLIYSTDDANDSTPLACIQAQVTNGKTVQTRYAGWPIACISGFGLVVSSFVSIMGHSATASHIASNAASLFIYFQNLAIMAMMGVARVPPIASAWAQNFMWSLGIIDVRFMQDMIYWYVQSTGGEVTSVLNNKNVISISVQRAVKKMIKRSISVVSGSSSDFSDDDDLYYTNEYDLTSKILVLRGIQRVSFLANIEISNLFMTGIIFFLFVGFVLIVLISIFRGVCEILVRSGSIAPNRFLYFRKRWYLVIKGSIYRYIDITFSTVVLLCVWEFTQNNSSGCLAFAIIIFAVCLVLMSFAAFRITFEGLKSVSQHGNPAYTLFGNDKFYFKYGFLYAQYLAKRYYWVTFHLFYLFIRALLIAALQESGKVCAVIIFVIEIIHSVVLIIFRPYMDRRTNIFNIFIAIINLINSIFFLFYSNVFGQPQVVSSVAAVVYFVLNAIFALILLIFTIVTCTIALLHKNPDVRYEQVKDDRAAFMVNENGNHYDEEVELAALGATVMQGQRTDSFIKENAGLPETSSKSTSSKLSPQDLEEYDNSKTNFMVNDQSQDSQNISGTRMNPFDNRENDIESISYNSYSSYDRQNPFSSNNQSNQYNRPQGRYR